MGRKIPLSNVFLDEITGEPVEHYVVVDRQKIAREGVMIIIAEINSQTGQLASELDVLIKGFVYEEMNIFKKKLYETLSVQFRKRQEQVSNWVFFKRAVEKEAERMLFKEKRSPLVVSVILEV
jgi:ribonuclease J